MCYNIAFLTKKLEKYAERYKESLPELAFGDLNYNSELPVFYFVSGFEHPVLPVITASGIVFARWGLVPGWTKNQQQANEISKITLNAMGETVFQKPSFKQSISTKRCLLGISGFYEWRQFNKVKYPYFISTANDEIMTLGCLYDTWTNPVSGNTSHSFSIITTPANPLMETIHNTKKRMPLILDRQHEKLWITGGLNEHEIQSMIQPYPGNDLNAVTISMLANNVRNNRNIPGIMQPVSYPEFGLFG